jgi:hypothetical protein
VAARVVRELHVSNAAHGGAGYGDRILAPHDGVISETPGASMRRDAYAPQWRFSTTLQ